MPQIVPAVIAAISAVSVATVVWNAILLLGTLALSSYQKKKADRAARAQFDAAQVDRLVNINATLASREMVLGRVRKGGNIFFRSTVGQYNETFVECITLAAHEIDGVEQIYFNDVPVAIDGSGNVTTAPYARILTLSTGSGGGLGFQPVGAFTLTASVTTLPQTPLAGTFSVYTVVRDSDNLLQSSPVPFTLSGAVVTIAYDPSLVYYAAYQYQVLQSMARVRWYLGGPGQTADARLQSLLPGVWTANHIAAGVAYLICEFDYDETAFPSGIPTVTALIRGAKLYDPRDGSTGFSDSPPLMMRYTLLHPQFGKRTSLTATEDARIASAAAACNTAISFTGADLVNIYRGSTVVPFGSPARDVLDDLAQAMGGQWAYAAGEFYLRAGVYQSPVLALTDADLAVVQRDNTGSTSQSPITISTHRPRNDKVNTILPRIWDQAAGYVQTPIAPFVSSALVAADGAPLVQEVTMTAVFYAPQAFHIAGIMLRDGRDPLTVTLPFKLRVYPIELFDGVTLTLSRYGWVAKEFQVLGRSFSPEGFLQLTLKETSAAIYQYGAGFVPQGYASNSGLPRPWDIHPPTITSIDSGEDQLIVQSDGTITNAVQIVWSSITDASVNPSGTVEVQYQDLTTGVWASTSVPGNAIQAFFFGIADRTPIVIRARTRNAVAVSDWSAQISHIVVGKTAPPPDIQNLSIAGSVLSWTLPGRVPDLAGFIFRFQYGSSFDWNSATPMHTGVITHSPFDLVTRPSGPVTIMGKAIDTTGNMSLSTANIATDLGDALIANIVVTWDFNALSWPYSAADSSGWTIVAGKPTATALDSFYGTGNQSFYGNDTDPFYTASTYGQMVYVTGEVSISAALSGSLMTLVTTSQGVDLRIEYRLAGPGPFYGADTSSFYGADVDPMYGPAGAWQPWPGQIVASNDVYQFRVTIGAGPIQGILQTMVLTVDAPDINESIANLAVSAGGTTIPFTKPFTAINVVNATLQANGSGAITVEIDKTIPMAPSIKAYNAAHTAVSGATVDILLQGY